jgi:glucose-6-phosphate 1-epimerase
MTSTSSAELNRKFGITGVAEIDAGNGGLPRVRVSGAFGQGEVYLHGAHVTAWKPVGQDEMLFVSSKSRWEDGQAIRGGIPVCFPWFRAKSDNPKAPAHGFVRTKTWQLQSISECKDGVGVAMFTESDESTRSWWPGDFRLMHRVTFGATLKLELVCTNTGKEPFRFEEALHTYNRVADIAQAKIQRLDNAKFLDNTDSNKEKLQNGDLSISLKTDNAYMNTAAEVDLVDSQLRRRIRLHKEGSRTTVVWNPWEDGAVSLKDLGGGEWRQFLCVEASNILSCTVNLDPGEEHTMTAVLRVESL